MAKEYTFTSEKHYVVWARNYDEAVRIINSELEYNYVIKEKFNCISVMEEE